MSRVRPWRETRYPEVVGALVEKSGLAWFVAVESKGSCVC
jgi:hypothetical protein